MAGGRATAPPPNLQLEKALRDFSSRCSNAQIGLGRGENGPGSKWPNHADFLTFGGFGDFCRPTGCQNFENSGGPPFAPSLFPRQSEAKTKRLVRFERARSLLPAEDGRVGAPPLTFPLGLQGTGRNLATFRGWRASVARYRKNSVEIGISGPSSP